jgi:hypothetical protein
MCCCRSKFFEKTRSQYWHFIVRSCGDKDDVVTLLMATLLVDVAPADDDAVAFSRRECLIAVALVVEVDNDVPS